MTAQRPSKNRPPQTEPDETLRVNSPGDLIAAIPAMLGFYPQRSLVLVTFLAQSRLVGPVMRIDLPGRSSRGGVDLGDALDQLAAACESCGVASAMAVFVDDRDDREGLHSVIADDLDDLLDEQGCELRAAFLTSRIKAGATWIALGSDEPGGLVADPRSSAVTAAHVALGRPILDSRAELAATIERADDAALREFADIVTAEVNSGGRSTTFAEVVELIDASDAGLGLSPTRLARVALALANTDIRDAVFATALGEHAAAAERVWAEIVRRAPDHLVVEAAAALGYSAYVQGNGALVQIALDRALSINKRHRMSLMLQQALQSAMAPEAMRCVGHLGYELAIRLGVELPGANFPPLCECTGWARSSA